LTEGAQRLAKIGREDSIKREGEGSDGNSDRFRDDSKFVILSRKRSVLLNSPAVLETEIRIICTVMMALECILLIIMSSKSEFRLNANLAFKTDAKIVLCVCIVQIGGQMIKFRDVDEVLVNPFAIFETTRKVI
jgi:hypothetical protein